MTLTAHDWRTLAKSGVEADALAAMTGLPLAEVEARLRGPVAAPDAPRSPLSFLSRPDVLRSQWGRRMRA